MRASIRWVEQIIGAELDAGEVAERLTLAGVEIEEVVEVEAPDASLVIAEVVDRSPHPERDRLHIVRVHDGEGMRSVVCGAPNTPDAGARVVLARPGAHVGDMRIEARELAGVASEGMLCSEAEMGIGPDADGILIVDEEARPGTPIRALWRLDDELLEYTITPNRPDCLGHVGLAREIAVLMGLEFRYERGAERDAALIDESALDLARVRIEDAQGCPRYAAAVVRGVDIRPAPFVMRHRLHILGIRPVSNVVDVTNWILMLDNQPLHAFDLRLLPEGEVIVRRALENETIVTLDGVERSLISSDLVIASRERPVAVAGVMGGEGTSITDDTTDVLVECAYFDPLSIRRTSARLKLQSESSYRFERGTDPEPLPDIAGHAARLMVQIGGGGVARDVIDAYPREIEPARVPFRVSRASRIVGVGFDREECGGHLEGIGCAIEDAADDRFDVVTPTWRPDLTREIDLVEEVARLRGYDRIETTYPRIMVGPPTRASWDLVMRIKRALASNGLDEIVTLSFGCSKRLADMGFDRDPVALSNPLSSERDVMRPSLLPGLVDQLDYHASRSREPIGIFEVGTVFARGDGGLVDGVEERREAAGLLHGPRPSWLGEDRGHGDFHDIWGIVSRAASTIWDAEASIRRMVDPPAYLHPRSACALLVGGCEIGWVGELHPALARTLDIARDERGMPLPVGLFSFEVTDEPTTVPRFRPYSDMPPSERDLAMVFPEHVEVGAIVEEVRSSAGPLVEDVRVFDVFRGGNIEEGHKSVAVRIVFRAFDRTLTQEEVDGMVAEAREALESQLGGRLRSS